MNGVSFLFVFGKWARPTYSSYPEYLRVCLGFVSFWVIYSDFEVFAKRVLKGEA